MSNCKYCDKGVPLVIGKTNDYGVAIQYPRKLIAYGYDIHGYDSNGLVVKINYCPMCGKEIERVEEIGISKEKENMLIRSQDKSFVVNMDNVFVIETRAINVGTAIHIGSSDSYCNIAEYSTYAKAMKVLDMIQEAYERYEYEKAFKTGLTLFKTFQMPEDGSVEA